VSNELTGKIVFSSGKQADYDIWTLDFDQTALRQLTDGDFWNDKPRWWPDGRSIVYISNATGTPDIYRLSADGSEAPVPLIQNGRWNDCPAPSPDGDKLGFVSNVGENNELWLADPDGGNVRRLTDHPASDACFAWMPDGRHVLFSSDRGGNQDVFKLDITTGRTQQLTTDEGMDVYPVASPNGRAIAFVSNRQFAPQKARDMWSDRDLDVWLMRVDGSMPVRVTDNQGSDRCVAWSPDGSKLVYAASSEKSAAERLRIVDVTPVLQAFDADDEAAAQKAAAALRHANVEIERDGLEAKIGARRHSSFLTCWLPDSLARKLYDPHYFGSERFPDWHCGSAGAHGSKAGVAVTATK
jgi:TolB protein